MAVKNECKKVTCDKCGKLYYWNEMKHEKRGFRRITMCNKCYNKEV